MNKIKKVITSPFFAIGAFALAAVLLLTAGIGGASAALNDTSEVYQLDIDMQNIGVQVIENGVDRDEVKSETRNPSDTYELQFQNVPDPYEPGTAYDEVLTVKNTGDIDEYVRVIVYKYWTDAEGNKLTNAENSLDPDLIDLHFVTDNGWSIYDQTDERTILNYNRIVPCKKSVDDGSATEKSTTTSEFADKLTINGDIQDYNVTRSAVNTTEDKDGNITEITTTTQTVFDLGEVNFVIEVEAQGVQTHNAEDAMMSAWGYVPKNVVIEK